jgi:hypothetical protein
VLLQRAAGILPAVDLAGGLRAAGETAAELAADMRGCVADQSAVHMLGLLPDLTRNRIREVLRGVSVTRSTVQDTILTRDHMRSLAAAAFTASLGPGGTIERTALAPAQLAHLLEQAEQLETTAGEMAVGSPSQCRGPAADAISLAAESGQPLWCDDIVLRQRARAAGVAAFSVLDLTSVLRRRGMVLDTEAGLARRLAAQYVTDLPLAAADIIAVARAGDWRPGPAHTALARAGWWRDHEAGWEGAWIEIATAARGHSAEALTQISLAARAGALDHAAAGSRTQRFQQLAVLALAACHEAAQPPPEGFLAALADGIPGLAPRAGYILAALIGELQARAVPAAPDVAFGLLPGVRLP